MKKIIGWILAFFGVISFTGILIEISDLTTVILAYLITVLVVGFLFLVVYLLDSDS